MNSSLNIRRQTRDHRVNINLTDDEDKLLDSIVRFTGDHKATILRRLALKAAIQILSAEEQQFTLADILNEGAEQHL